MKNEGFTIPKIWVITPKDEGFTWVPMVLTNWDDPLSMSPIISGTFNIWGGYEIPIVSCMDTAYVRGQICPQR